MGDTGDSSPRSTRVAVPTKLLRLLLLTVAAANLASATDQLRPQSDLTSNCFNFPADNFSRENNIRNTYGTSPKALLTVGEGAIDFTLHDAEGSAWNLREALELGKPVVLIWGMYTCPAFEGMGTTPPWMKCSYRDQYDLVEEYKDRATFVHIYGPEPHPTTPGTNFDSGKVVDQYWSTVHQHRSYDDRLDMVARVRDYMHPDQVMLPDYIPGNPYSDLIQPVWCSYYLGARPAVVISPQGTVFFQQDWLQTEHVAHAIDLYWETAESSAEEGVSPAAVLFDAAGVGGVSADMGGRLKPRIRAVDNASP